MIIDKVFQVVENVSIVWYTSLFFHLPKQEKILRDKKNENES